MKIAQALLLRKQLEKKVAQLEPIRQMGENGRQYVEENHDISKIAEQHIQVFNHLVKPRGDG